MLKRCIVAALFSLFCSYVYVYGGETRVPNLFKTHKLSANTVIVTCVDGGRPIVSEGVTNSIMVLVSCESK